MLVVPTYGASCAFTELEDDTKKAQEMIEKTKHLKRDLESIGSFKIHHDPLQLCYEPGKILVRQRQIAESVLNLVSAFVAYFQNRDRCMKFRPRLEQSIHAAVKELKNLDGTGKQWIVAAVKANCILAHLLNTEELPYIFVQEYKQFLANRGQGYTQRLVLQKTFDHLSLRVGNREPMPEEFSIFTSSDILSPDSTGSDNAESDFIVLNPEFLGNEQVNFEGFENVSIEANRELSNLLPLLDSANREAWYYLQNGYRKIPDSEESYKRRMKELLFKDDYNSYTQAAIERETESQNSRRTVYERKRRTLKMAIYQAEKLRVKAIDLLRKSIVETRELFEQVQSRLADDETLAAHGLALINCLQADVVIRRIGAMLREYAKDFRIGSEPVNESAALLLEKQYQEVDALYGE